MEEKQGTISELIYHSRETHYTVAVVDGEQEQFTAVGFLPGADAGRTFSFKGEWKHHASYGEQFAFSEYQEEMPRTRDGIAAFLASGLIKGVGPKTAQSIVARFGEDTLRILMQEPGRLTEVDGIGPVKAAGIVESYRSHQEFAEVSLFFQKYGISAAYSMKLYQVYGPLTIQLVKENPYRIIDDIFGIGFKKADRIAEHMGISGIPTFASAAESSTPWGFTPTKATPLCRRNSFASRRRNSWTWPPTRSTRAWFPWPSTDR